MKYKLFISDYDGTLGGDDGIAEDTVKAIKEYEKRGGKFVVCTGRMYNSILKICQRYDIADVIVSYQGARINERKSGKTMFAGKISSFLVEEVLSDLKGLPVITALITDGILYYSESSEQAEAEWKKKAIDVRKVDDLLSFLVRQNIEVLKINLMCNKADVPEILRIYSEKYKGRLIVNSGSSTLVEFINPKCNKGNSVRFLADYYGIDSGEIIAVGDSLNDAELLNGSWHSVAVGNAKEELKAMADEVAVPYKDHPIKYLLEKYCL